MAKKKLVGDMSVQAMTDAFRFCVDQSGKTRYRIAQETGIGESHLSRNYAGTQGATPTVLAKVAECVGAKVEIVVTIGGIDAK